MGFGLTLNGLVPMRLEDVRAALEADIRDAIAQNVQLGPESVLGQIVGVIAERYADLWEVSEQVYASAYLAGASGAALDDLAALAALARASATLSVVTLTLGGVNGTVIPTGSIVADPDTNVEWTTLADATISGGVASTTASPAETGPVRALAGTITEIRTPITGWNTVTNPTDADEGTNAQTDAKLRDAFAQVMRSSGGNSVDGIAAQILRLDLVTEAVVIENATDFTDLEGRPPHSFEAVVLGGDDQEIGDAIWDSKPAGIQTHGDELTTVIDSAGDGHDVYWSRPTTTDIWMIVDYAIEPGFPEDIEDLILAAILDVGSALKIGDDVVPFHFIQAIDTAFILELSIRVGVAPNPVTDDPVVISLTAIADVDSSRISFNRTN